ncbi:hypothetical protein GCM10029964_087020 [Kibdelosporangium lantanae]
MFYPTRAHLAIIDIICYTGILAVALAATARDRRRLCATLLIIGLLSSATAVGLLASSHRNVPARGSTQAIIVPLLGQPGEPVAYTPVCASGPIPVCVHPAYSGDLKALTALIDPITAPLAGAPGMPVRAEQQPDKADLVQAFQVVGTPPVLVIAHFIVHHDTIDPPELVRNLRTRIAIAFVTPPGPAPQQLTPAQRAAAVYLLRQAHDTPDPALGTAALDGAWLVQHLGAVRDGSIKDIP